MAEPRLRTPGIVARTLGVPLSRVLYVLNHRPHIRPAARAGILRLYDAEALAAVKVEIDRLDARRGRKGGTRG